MKRIYADHAATTPMTPAALKAYAECAGRYTGNPSSRHAFGREAFSALTQARNTIAECLRCAPEEMVFTSGGTESDNMALWIGAAEGRRRGKSKILFSAVEHAAVTRAAENLQGMTAVPLPVDENALIRPETLEKALDDDTAMVSVMLVNNETGTVEPIRDLAAICRKRGVLFHTDAVQAVGQIPVDLNAAGADLLSWSAHKFGGPRGVGGLYLRGGAVRGVSLIRGGSQEKGLRAGTENVPGIAAAAAALADRCRRLPEMMADLKRVRAAFEDRLAGDGRLSIHAKNVERCPGISSVSLRGADADNLLIGLDAAGIAVSGGAACGAGRSGMSHVLLAMGLPGEDIRGTLRVSFGEGNTVDDAAAIAAWLLEAAKEI